MDKQLFIISNRLPVTIELIENEPQIRTSSGGLVSAISGYLKNAKDSNFSAINWVGFPGCTAATWDNVNTNASPNEYNYLPVFINKKTYEHYYNGLSNSTIWPLFHYFPSYAEFHADHYAQYQRANAEFLNVILKHARNNDVIWIHDYHLLPLAGMIRKELPDVTIGFFLHIPFPSFEIFRIMPKSWQEDIMHGILGADLIGFHTIDYASHFLKCAQMILGLDNDMHILHYQNRIIKIDVFPISIDFEQFHNAYDDPEVIALRNTHEQQFENKKVIFSVDRLDYTKGVYNRLKAFERFLKLYPEYRENVVFILIVVPSRDGISKYAERKKIIDEYIGNLNSQEGTINWQPVIYRYTSLSFHELIAMYTLCDLALITPLRDGMNLVAKEFVTSRKDHKGVLVLSEMAGAVRELTGALTINPNDIDEIAHKINSGLIMDEQEQAKRIKSMQQRIHEYDVKTWADDFLSQLFAIKKKQNEFQFKFFDTGARNESFQKYDQATKRLLLLDYDGTLIPFSSFPNEARPSAQVLELLDKLAANPRNTVYIISGRDSQTLDGWLGQLNINIISEHGAKARINGKGWQNIVATNNHWQQEIVPIMQSYTRRCAGSFVETKDFSVAWHYRNANREQAKLRASELYAELSGYTNNLGLQVITGNKVMEVRNKGVDKGSITEHILRQDDYDFILACGDDRTDEDMFRKLSDNPNAYTIKVGAEASYAKYNLHTSQMVTSLLETMSNI